VLVAEEDPEVREALSILLTNQGYEVVAVRAAHELLAALEDTQLLPEQVPSFHAVVCDVTLAGTGRAPLLSLLRRMSPSVPLVVMTSPDDPLTQAEAFRRAADAVMDKPIDPAHLLTVLRIIAPPEGY
jgi:CheY-like chemotaxis protein